MVFKKTKKTINKKMKKHRSAQHFYKNIISYSLYGLNKIDTMVLDSIIKNQEPDQIKKTLILNDKVFNESLNRIEIFIKNMDIVDYSTSTV